jgi:thioredoxin-like negative regulator of GroEL
MRRLALLACVIGFACKGSEKSEPPAAKEPAAASACAKAKQHGTLAWIEDDYASALACARERKVPLVLDLWAPWCHTCLSMQTTVFTDPAFAADKDQFVFAALDTDREANAAAVGKFAISAWPTFYVIGNDEAVLARFIGAATVGQFREFLASGARAATGGGAAADSRLLGAQRALAKKDFATANEELTAAIAAAPEAWPQRPEALHALLMVKSKLGDVKACLDVAEKYMDAAGNTALGTNFVAYATGCAENAMKDAPDRAKALRDKGIARLQALLADKASPLSVDDRAEAMGYLRDALDASGKKDDAKQVAEQIKTLLDDAMDKAATPLEAMTHLWLRCEVYAWLGRPLELVPAVEKLATQLPEEYDPPARLGWLYLKAGKLNEAATWTEKALALVYGPRKGRVLSQRAEIAKAAGDKTAERSFREQAVKLWESLPPGQQSPDNLEKAKQALAALDASAAGSATANK